MAYAPLRLIQGILTQIRETTLSYNPNNSNSTFSISSAVEEGTLDSTANGNHADTSADRATDANSSLKLLRLRNIGRVIVGYLNINSITIIQEPIDQSI